MRPESEQERLARGEVPRLVEEVRRWRREAYEFMRSLTPEQWARHEQQLIEKFGLEREPGDSERKAAG